MFALGALAAQPAVAQSLQRLHVRSFVLSSDAPAVQREQPFNVTLTIRVAERLTRLDNVYLPSFSGAEELGDERSISPSGSGTVYRETLRLVAHQSGPLAIGSAYFDAIDARDGRPKRFISNGITVRVSGETPYGTAPVAALISFACAAALMGALAWLLVRRPPRQRIEPEQSIEPPQPEPQAAFEEALAQLHAHRDRRSVLLVRERLWEMLDAPCGATLHDVLRRPLASHPRTRRLLLALERAAFVSDDRLHSAVEEIVL
ncbi:MAG: hypothetical protein ABR508_03990 [Candidatus Baltobacteraceae bacterium]